MKRYIVFALNYYFFECICKENDIPKNQAIYFNGDDINKIRGYYNYVMRDKIKLIGMTKKEFHGYYVGRYGK